MIGPSGDVETIEYRYLKPVDSNCGEEHVDGLIWVYFYLFNVHLIDTLLLPFLECQVWCLTTFDLCWAHIDYYNSTIQDIYYVTYDPEYSKSYHCDKELESGKRYSIAYMDH